MADENNPSIAPDAAAIAPEAPAKKNVHLVPKRWMRRPLQRLRSPLRKTVVVVPSEPKLPHRRQLPAPQRPAVSAQQQAQRQANAGQTVLRSQQRPHLLWLTTSRNFSSSRKKISASANRWQKSFAVRTLIFAAVLD